MLVETGLEFAQKRRDIAPAQSQPVLARRPASKRLGPEIEFVALLELADDGLAVAELVGEPQRVVFHIGEKTNPVVAGLHRLPDR